MLITAGDMIIVNVTVTLLTYSTNILLMYFFIHLCNHMQNIWTIEIVTRGTFYGCKIVIYSAEGEHAHALKS